MQALNEYLDKKVYSYESTSFFVENLSDECYIVW